jgi:hypothetical protein
MKDLEHDTRPEPAVQCTKAYLRLQRFDSDRIKCYDFEISSTLQLGCCHIKAGKYSFGRIPSDG